MSNWPIQTGAGAPFVGAGINADMRAHNLPVAALHTPGPWVEVVTAAPRGMAGLALHAMLLPGDSSGFTHALFDIGIGPAGEEVVVVPGLPIQADFYRWYGVPYTLPFAVSPGTRITMRAQTNRLLGADGYRVSVLPTLGAALAPVVGADFIEMGVDRASSRGTFVQAQYGGGAWVELTASTPRRLRGLYVCHLVDEFSAWSFVALRVAVGGAGAETAVIEMASSPTNPTIATVPVSGPYWLNIPAGARLSAQAWSGASPYVHLIGIV